MTEPRIVAPCPACEVGDIYAVPGAPIPSVCEACRREAESWSETA
jgi:hypothetical protein